uniref:Uncharacterized protein n=1 Tax=Physcomitrium patens TaxID=3218 RepID=A0A2K1IAY6_PHYPA|nr:hypothetical protein PHYPA_031011 [Physcomitrium patens]
MSLRCHVFSGIEKQMLCRTLLLPFSSWALHLRKPVKAQFTLSIDAAHGVGTIHERLSR